MLGQGRAAVAGGTESMSMVPMGGNKISPNPALVSSYPDVYLSTGLVAENHARESTVSRVEQDEFALRSHQRAVSAIEKGHFKNEIVPLTVRIVQQNGDKPAVKELTFDTDEGPRRDTSLEALAKLKPAFHVSGSVTAGNSSQTAMAPPPHHLGRARQDAASRRWAIRRLRYGASSRALRHWPGAAIAGPQTDGLTLDPSI